MSTLYITRGLPAAGKTTWAKAWVAEAPGARARVNRDDLRAMLFETPDYSWAQERATTEASRSMVKALLAADLDVVADDMNLRPKYVREWLRFARANKADVEVVEFPISVEESIERDAQRDRVVGADVIRGMVGKYLRREQLLPIPDEDFDASEADAYEVPEGAPSAVIVDIDGTLALNTQGRSPYDLTRVSEDTPNRAVIEAVHAAYHQGANIIYLSGREDSCRTETGAWLETHVGIAGPLYMRSSEDKRRDSIVKRELFDEHVRSQYDVLYVLDDRNQVVEMWRSLGLTVFQVAEGDF